MERIFHTVTQHGSTKAGKPVVYFDNKHSFRDMIFLGKTAAPPVGSVIDVEMSSLPRDDGSKTWFLNKWGMAPQEQQPKASESRPLPMNNGTAPIGASPQMSAPSGYTEPERMFVSNIVAAAVTGGKIVDPIDLQAWCSAALHALRHMNDTQPSDGKF